MSKNILSKAPGSIYATVEVILFREEESWIAYCPALDLSSYGDDPEDARKAFGEALQVFLSETARKGTLERYLLKLGWQLQQKPKPVYNPPALSLQKEKELLQKSSRVFSEKIAIPVA